LTTVMTNAKPNLKQRHPTNDHIAMLTCDSAGGLI